MAAVETPTGVILGSFTPGTPEWEEARGGLCITATEIAAVMSLSPWQSRFSLWHKKAGLPHPPFEPSSAAEWGVRLEDAVALKYAELHPEVNVSPAGTFRHRDREWQRATPDRLGSDRIVEVKTSPFGDGWEQGVPVHYRCQVIWQMDTLGYRRTDIALLVSGHEYREYTVEYDPVDAKILRHSAAQFLNSVKLGERPPIDESGHTYQTIRLQPAGRLDIDVPVPGELADRYAADRAALDDADRRLTSTKSELLDLIGDGYRAVTGDRRVAYRTVKADGTTLALQPYTRKKTVA
jgi:putative phage-type endonuclease